jgi:hypothetical protein
MYAGLSRLTRQYEHAAERSLKASRVLQWGIVAASAGSVLSALTATALVVPWSGVAGSLALIYACWLAGWARKHEQAAARLSVLRAEVSHSFGPSGEVLRPSEYYPASTRRIELLLDEIKATVGNGRAV